MQLSTGSCELDPGRIVDAPVAPADRQVIETMHAGHDWYRVPSYDGYAAGCDCGASFGPARSMGGMMRAIWAHLESVTVERLTG